MKLILKRKSKKKCLLKKIESEKWEKTIKKTITKSQTLNI